MTAAQLQTLTPASPDEQVRNRYVRARFEALAEWGIPTEDALAIADSTDIDVVEAVGLLRHGCRPDLVLSILG